MGWMQVDSQAELMCLKITSLKCLDFLLCHKFWPQFYQSQLSVIFKMRENQKLLFFSYQYQQMIVCAFTSPALASRSTCN